MTSFAAVAICHSSPNSRFGMTINNAVLVAMSRLYTTKSDFAELLRIILAQNQWQQEPVGTPGWFALLAEGGGDIYPQRHITAIILPTRL